MQHVQDLQDRIFFEAQNILETLAKISTKEELVNKQDLLSELSERVSFLKFLEKNKDAFAGNESSQNVNNQHLSSNSEFENNFEDRPFEEDVIEEEVMFTNDLNDIDDENSDSEETETVPEVLNHEKPDFHKSQPVVEEPVVSEEIQTENSTHEGPVPMIIENEDPTYAERIAEKERLLHEQEEKRRNIVEFTREPHEKVADESAFEAQKNIESHHEKKFKLANIKGLKSVQSLFDDDPLEKIEEEKSHTKSETGSLLKSNMPIEFMEATKQKPEFKLDLNDRVAFTKVLFKGNEADLKYTVDKLNSFTDLEEARQYLSDIYYEKDWKKADEYAQRLWNLVENKFL